MMLPVNVINSCQENYKYYCEMTIRQSSYFAISSIPEEPISVISDNVFLFYK